MSIRAPENHETSKAIVSTKQISNFRRALPQFLAVAVKNFLLFGYGMTLGFPTIVIPAIQGGDGRDPHHDIILNKDEISWFSSINLLCVPLGCIFSGIFTQPIGKRMAMQIVNIPILAAWLLFYFSTNIYYLYAGLCLSGLSGGLMEAPVLTYVAEITEPRFRGMLAATGSTCLIFGVFTQFLLGTFLKWRTIAAISTIFPVLSIIALFFIPESPHWLMLKGRLDETRRSLAWLRGWVPIQQIEAEYNKMYEILVMQPSQIVVDSSKSSCMRKAALYKKKNFLVPYALVTLTFFIGHFSGKTPLQTYAVQIFHTLKAPIDKYYATVLLGAVEIIGTLICVVLVHYTGKRPLVLVSTIGCGLCFFGTATYARFLDLVPGVAVENIVANVSALDLNKGNLITAVNVTDIVEKFNLVGKNISLPVLLQQFNHTDDYNDPGNLSSTEFDYGSIADRLRRSEEFNDTKIVYYSNSSNGLDFDYNFNSTSDYPTGDDLFVLGLTSVNYTYTEYDEYGEKKNNVTPKKSVVPLPVDDSVADHKHDELVLQIPKVHENRFIWLPLTLLLLSAMFAHMGIKLIPWMLIGEVFPASVRSGASGISGGTGYMFGFLANKLFLRMLATMTLPGTFWFYSAVALVGAVVLYFVLPETEGRTLLEIEQHFSGGKQLSDRTEGNGEMTAANGTVPNPGMTNISRGQDHVSVPIMYTTPATGGGNHHRTPVKMELTNWDGNRIFQKHLEEHRQRLDGNQHMFHNNGVRRNIKKIHHVDPEPKKYIYSTHL